MKIEKVNVIPLRGASVDGGWAHWEDAAKDNLHTLIEVVTDEGIKGIGSVFTCGSLVQGAMELLWPLLKTPLDPLEAPLHLVAGFEGSASGHLAPRIDRPRHFTFPCAIRSCLECLLCLDL